MSRVFDFRSVGEDQRGFAIESRNLPLHVGPILLVHDGRQFGLCIGSGESGAQPARHGKPWLVRAVELNLRHGQVEAPACTEERLRQADRFAAPEGATPITVTGTPLSWMVLPTICGSASNWFFHNGSLSTATCARAPRSHSPEAKNRPISG